MNMAKGSCSSSPYSVLTCAGDSTQGQGQALQVWTAVDQLLEHTISNTSTNTCSNQQQALPQHVGRGLEYLDVVKAHKQHTST